MKGDILRCRIYEKQYDVTESTITPFNPVFYLGPQPTRSPLYRDPEVQGWSYVKYLSYHFSIDFMSVLRVSIGQVSVKSLVLIDLKGKTWRFI